MNRFARVWVMLFVLLVLPRTNAQTDNSMRVLRASYVDDELVIDLQILDETVRAATLTIDGDERAMALNALRPEITHWFLLDAGESMVDAYPLIRDELVQVASAVNDRYRIGFATYGAEIDLVPPSNSPDDLINWAQTYRAVPAVQACVFDAIEQLPDAGSDLLLITVITGSQETVLGCTAPSQGINGVLDVIQAGAPDNTGLVAIAETSGGLVLSRPLNRLASAFDNLTSARNSQTQTIRLPLREPVEQGTLAVELSNGDIITREIQPTGTLRLPATATPPPTATIVTSTPTPVPSTPVPTDVPTTVPATELVVVPTQIPEQIEPETGSNPNGIIILVGGLVVVIVAGVVMYLLLRGNRNLASEETTYTAIADQTAISTGAMTKKLDTTHVVSMRDLASQLGDTHAANLLDINDDSIYEIHRPVSVLGRQADSDILLEGDMQISREHVRFEVRDNDEVWLVRLTTNPILVNGIPVENVVRLNEGDRIQLSPSLSVVFTSIIGGGSE